MKKVPLILFALAAVGELYAQATELSWLHHICKPLLMIFLGLYYLINSGAGRSWLVLFAVVFSFLGDGFLMYDSIAEMYFMLGLGSFLAAHLFYLFAYREHSDRKTERTSNIIKLRLSFPVVLAATGLIIILFPGLGELQLPVMVYAFILMIMVIAAIYRLEKTPFDSFLYVFSGAVLFMVSDSLLAVNKFLTPISGAGFWIMLSYIAAQYLIITGLLKHQEVGDY